MIFDSFLPPELLTGQPAAPPAALWRLEHGLLEGYYDSGAFCVQRVISTDLRDYLDPRYRPGSRLSGPRRM